MLMLKNIIDVAVPLTVVLGVLVGYFTVVAAFWGGML
jgi:hypothetical protein